MSKQKIAVEFQDARAVFAAEGDLPDLRRRRRVLRSLRREVCVEAAAVDAMGVTGWVEIASDEARAERLEELLVALARGQARVYRKDVQKEKHSGR